MGQAPVSGDRISALETIIDVAELGTWIWNVQTGETEFNEYWARMLGYTLDELEPVSIDTWLSVLVDEDYPVTERALQAHFEGRTAVYDCEVRVRHRDGREIWIRDFGKVISWTPDGRPEWVSGAHLEITEQKELEARLRELSFTDPLTQIPNRRVFMERLNESYELFSRRGIPAAVVMIDIDHFKTVNDTYGHGAGDEVIRRVASILADRVRESDVPCRLGGEEFGLLLPGTGIDEAMDLAERLRLEIAGCSCTTSRGEAFQVTLSVGVSRFAGEDEHPEQALQRADAALYQGKATGRNRVVKDASIG